MPEDGVAMARSVIACVPCKKLFRTVFAWEVRRAFYTRDTGFAGDMRQQIVYVVAITISVDPFPFFPVRKRTCTPMKNFRAF